MFRGAIRAMTDSAPSLQHILDPVTPEAFFRDHWERAPLAVNRGRPGHFAGLLSLDDIDRVVTTMTLAHPEISMVDAERALRTEDYTHPSGMIDPARLYQRFADGGTIILSQLQRRLPALDALCRTLERSFSCRFQTNIYLTPAGAKGFKAHYDTHDVFVLQLAGAKHWRIYDTPVELPHRGQGFAPEFHPPGPVSQDFTLQPGDTAYVPRGVMHDAVSGDALSLHVTVGVIATTWSDLMIEALSAVCLDDPAFRRTLPPGFAQSGYDFDRTAARATFAELARVFADRAAAEPARFDAALAHFIDDLVDTRHALLRGQMGQVLRLAELAPDTPVGARPDLICRWAEDGETVRLACCGSELVVPAHAGPALRFAVATPRFTAADLPGDLDEAGRLTLIRRLIREGLVRVL